MSERLTISLLGGLIAMVATAAVILASSWLLGALGPVGLAASVFVGTVAAGVLWLVDYVTSADQPGDDEEQP